MSNQQKWIDISSNDGLIILCLSAVCLFLYFVAKNVAI